MSNEGEVVGAPWTRTMFSAELYKRSQGRTTRQATFGALALIVALGCWALSGQLAFTVPQSTRYAIVGAILLAGWWLSFRLVNMPRFADFLISVEAEMSKVSWPTRSDLVNTSAVVMVVIFGMAAVLFLYDIVWQWVLKAIGVLPQLSRSDRGNPSRSDGGNRRRTRGGSEVTMDDNESTNPNDAPENAAAAGHAPEPAAEEGIVASRSPIKPIRKADEITGPSTVESWMAAAKASKKDVVKPVATGKRDWYILKVQSNREDSIREALQRRVKIQGLDEFFGDIIVPIEKVTEFKTGKKRVVKRKLYPGYIVVNMELNDDTWFLVRETGGIGDFTGSGGKPTPMASSDVAKIVQKPKDETDEAPKLTFKFDKGDRVKVTEGMFENLEGEVDGIDRQNGRVTVMISIFGRSTPVELEYWQLEAL